MRAGAAITAGMQADRNADRCAMLGIIDLRYMLLAHYMFGWSLWIVMGDRRLDIHFWDCPAHRRPPGPTCSCSLMGTR